MRASVFDETRVYLRQEDWNGTSLRIVECRSKTVECLVTRASSHHSRHSTAESSLCKESLPSLAELRTKAAIVAPALNI